MDFEVFKNTVLDASDEDILDITLRDLPQSLRKKVDEIHDLTGSIELGVLKITLSSAITLRICDAIESSFRTQDVNILRLNWIQRIVFKVFFRKEGGYVF
jgi:hypothetical protein